EFLDLVQERLRLVDMDESMLSRSVNQGFSGGEKKRNEIFQMAVLSPRLAILDETDSGLDIDALRIVAEGVNKLRSPENATIVVTHYQRLLNYIIPDYVHVLANGRIVKSGGKELALELEEHGYPTTKNEDWHFTSVAPIAERAFRLAAPASQAGTDRRESIRRKSDFANALGLKPADLERFGFGQTDWHRLVFINGVFDESLSSFEEVGDAIRVGSLASAIESGALLVERYLGKIASFDQHTFTALNTAFISDGAFIELARDAVVEQPIHLLFISGGDGVSHPRNVIVAERHSRAAVIESYVSLRDGAYFTNAVTEIVVGEGAHIDHYKLQRESESAFHVGTVQIREERDSQLHSFSFAVGGSLARTNIYTSLNGNAATCTLNGLYLTDGTQHIDNQTSIEHIAPNCPSHA